MRRISEKVKITEGGKLSDQLRKKIVEECRRLGLSPIRFNMGAWYVAINALDLFLNLMRGN